MIGGDFFLLTNQIYKMAFQRIFTVGSKTNDKKMANHPFKQGESLSCLWAFQRQLIQSPPTMWAGLTHTVLRYVIQKWSQWLILPNLDGVAMVRSAQLLGPHCSRRGARLLLGLINCKSLWIKASAKLQNYDCVIITLAYRHHSLLSVQLKGVTLFWKVVGTLFSD